MLVCKCMVCNSEFNNTHTHTHLFSARRSIFVPWELADVFADCVAATCSFSVNSSALESSFQGASNAT